MLKPKNCIFGILFFFSLCLLEGGCFLYEEYYWQDFQGVIPKNALAGGKDINGKPIYIGQVLYASKLLPAKIYGNDNKAYYTWGVEYSTTKDIKILCAPHPERFKWVPTKKNEIHKLINHRPVRGGWEPGYDLYIGRAFYKSETLVGRVRVAGVPTSNLGLYISADKKEVIVNDFEILTYDPENTDKEVRFCNNKVIHFTRV
ncbi:hypothetical protein FQA39_LY11562 [Lamprigera yunnana]|nr:hypothetical protein FQA39_LY11562 [Lamprigera yunnana]